MVNKKFRGKNQNIQETFFTSFSNDKPKNSSSLYLQFLENDSFFSNFSIFLANPNRKLYQTTLNHN